MIFRKIINIAMTSSLLLSGAVYSGATEPTNYYSSCENKSGAELLSALQAVVGPHTVISYDNLWSLYKTTDVNANGLIWDIYSTKEWTPISDQCGSTISYVGHCYNREHSMPKSWFSDASPMVSDAFHIYPTDGKVNNQRSNYPYGECENGTTLSSTVANVQALGRLGQSTFEGYTKTVFEPDNAYKGDIARTYFYMAAAYNDQIGGWTSDMLANNSYPAFTEWSVNLLLKWHRQDPVSEKEINRNEAIYAKQQNRNPFIDHPELVEYIWGDKKTEGWTLAAGNIESISLPVSGSTIDIGMTGIDFSRSKTITVKGSSLQNDVTVSISGEGFKASATTLAAADVNSGTTLTVEFISSREGNYTGTLTLKSGDVESTANLTATVVTGIPASAATLISDCSFTANWSYIGKADSNGKYNLYVTNTADEVLSGYPISVTATEESALVDKLSSLTAYKYYLEGEGVKSNTIEVTTAAPSPTIEFITGNDISLTTTLGNSSAAQEIEVDMENVSENVTLTINSPFELSSDKNSWNSTLSLDPREDRFYIRLVGTNVGTFTAVLTASIGTYQSELTVGGTITKGSAFFEGFENKNTGTSYTETSVDGDEVKWALSNAGVFKESGEQYSGYQYMRFGKNKDSSITMSTDNPNGVGTLSFYAAGWSSGDGETKFDVEYSTDGGSNWTKASSFTITKPTSSTKLYSLYSKELNISGPVRVRFVQTSGARWCLDHIIMLPYSTAGLDDIVADSRNNWDAYCYNGQLMVELNEAAKVIIYSLDGIARHNSTLGAGTTAINLSQGLYIVTVNGSSRRVLVK